MFSYRNLCMAGAAVCAISTAFPAAAETKAFDIPAQPASTGIPEFGRQSGLQVLAAQAAVGDQKIAALKGEYEPREALKRILASTNLTVASDDGRTVTLAPQSQSAGGGAETNVVQELVVTAQKKSENIQVVPIAISAFTQQDLTTRQVAGGPDLMTQVPNFTFTKTNFSGYSIQIRGIGTQAISATTDPAVAVAFNNTPFIRNRFFEQEFYDLERLEVLRGPQGTLYGRNATAGVVNLISAKPNFSEFEAKASADVGNYSSKRLEGMVNIPLVDDKAGLRLAGAWTKRDGYVTNLLTGQQTDGRDLWSGRATLGIEPNTKFKANLIYEHFSENDDRLRSGKQLCHKDPGPAEINGVPIVPGPAGLSGGAVGFFSQGCIPASLYSPDSFQTPNGYSLPYYGAAAALGSPVYGIDPYVSQFQSRNLRAIETHIVPQYQASTDTVELQMQYQLTDNLTLASETGFNHDQIFSFEDYNRFDTLPGMFKPGANLDPARYDIVDQNGVFCDPQLGCTSRVALGDLSTAKSKQFSQEFRLSSNFDGPFNFNVGANFLRYDTEDKYYVFINSITVFEAGASGAFNPNDKWIPGVSDNSYCYSHSNSELFDIIGYVWSNPNRVGTVGEGCTYIDPNNIHNLNDEGRNYFLSRNPYHLLSYAGFGEAYYQIAPDLKLTAGFRWTDDRKVAPQIPSWLIANMTYGTPARKIIRQEWSEPTGRLALDWKPKLSFTDETLLYASYVRGYKAGGANPPPAIPVFAPVSCAICGNDPDLILQDSLTHPQTFKPEFVNAFEVGSKNTLLDGRLTLNLDAFYYDYTGYQISEIVDRSAVNLNFDAKIWGAEIETDWRPLKNLRLSFKGGYENTRLADGSNAIDLMDRTAGHPGWTLMKPFPTFPSNCIVPTALVFVAAVDCEAYKVGRATWYAPNNGEGFAKDLSGNALPNAPKFTATLTTDYTLPLGENWLATLHGDFYYQSEAWTRVFNDPGYDRLKAYNNVNFALIFANDKAGLQVMTYVKNAFNKDNITGAFLNSDDTGLTTNVFLNEPRLYGVRLTKTWDGGAPFAGLFSPHVNHGGWYPFRVELDGDYGHFTDAHELLAPHTVSLFPADHPYPLDVQSALDWGAAGGVKFTYQPSPNGWFASAGVRYGRARGSADGHTKWIFPGGYTLAADNPFVQRYPSLRHIIDPSVKGWYDYSTTTGKSSEAHTIADFAVGRDVGLGIWGDRGSSIVDIGIRYAHLQSSSNDVLHGRPDFYLPPDNIRVYGGHLHRMHASMDVSRDFEGTGPTVNWSGQLRFFGDPGSAGGLGVDAGLGGALLWGKQRVKIKGQVTEEYLSGIYQPAFPSLGKYGEHVNTTTRSLDTQREKQVTVPGVNANLGLTYTLGGLKLSGGYRIERYFNAIDGGIETRKTYDRQYDGPYFKVSFGFGG